MRKLKFIVTGQQISKDPFCDFSGLMPGTNGYLKTAFSFDDAWKGCEKIAEFRKYLNSESVPVRLQGDVCMIPAEVLTGSKFSISVIGVRPGYRITTNTVGVRQDG